MSDRDLERRIELLEDERAIQALVRRYATLCDQRYAPDPLAELFTEDAVWSSASPDGSLDFGTRHGREAIRGFFQEVTARIAQPTLHMVSAPEIDVAPDRQSATGRWYTVVLLTMEEGPGQAAEVLMLGGTYAHDYRRVGGAWRFSRVAATLHFHLPVGAGVIPAVSAMSQER
jgi:ketosteroid isomerase-like protein